jgi:hypothetical protein
MKDALTPVRLKRANSLRIPWDTIAQFIAHAQLHLSAVPLNPLGVYRLLAYNNEQDFSHPSSISA